MMLAVWIQSCFSVMIKKTSSIHCDEFFSLLTLDLTLALMLGTG